MDLFLLIPCSKFWLFLLVKNIISLIILYYWKKTYWTNSWRKWFSEPHCFYHLKKLGCTKNCFWVYYRIIVILFCSRSLSVNIITTAGHTSISTRVGLLTTCSLPFSLPSLSSPSCWSHVYLYSCGPLDDLYSTIFSPVLVFSFLLVTRLSVLVRASWRLVLCHFLSHPCLLLPADRTSLLALRGNDPSVACGNLIVIRAVREGSWL